MTYRVNSNDSDYLLATFDNDELFDKFEGDYLISVNPAPIKFADVWQELTVEFVDEHKDKKVRPIPDIQFFCGHLFLSDKATEVLKPLIKDLGELLPVKYGDKQTGYVFNPLKVVEADPSQSTKSEYGDATFITFSEDHALFKTDFDTFYGVFCNQAFKDAVEENGLTGAVFELDLSNIFTRDGLSEKPKTN